MFLHFTETQPDQRRRRVYIIQEGYTLRDTEYINMSIRKGITTLNQNSGHMSLVTIKM